jgi:hypothetical protein
MREIAWPGGLARPVCARRIAGSGALAGAQMENRAASWIPSRGGSGKEENQRDDRECKSRASLWDVTLPPRQYRPPEQTTCANDAVEGILPSLGDDIRRDM